MAMGSTGIVNMTPEMILQAKSAVDDYRVTAGNLRETLDGIVAALVPGNFSGSAAEGFKKFHEDKIVPAIDAQLLGLLNALDQMLDGALQAIPGDKGVDEELATGNQQ